MTFHCFWYSLEGHCCNMQTSLQLVFIRTFIRLQIIRNSVGIYRQPSQRQPLLQATGLYPCWKSLKVPCKYLGDPWRSLENRRGSLEGSCITECYVLH